MASDEGVGPIGPYRYPPLPLNHIRLIRLEPSSDPSAPLRCTLSDSDLQTSDIPYEALSYAWGPPKFDHDLYVGDDAVLRITSSLHGALKRLRRYPRPRRVWADAVCINQASDVEKRVQIPLMRNIFQGANAVLVWLGGGDETASALHQLGLQARRLTVPGSKLHKPETVVLRDMTDEILRLPWFMRRWVIQEVVLNANVLLCAGTAAELNWTRFVASVVECYPDAVGRLIGDGPGESKCDNGSARVQTSVMKMFELWKELALPLARPDNRKCGVLALLSEFDEHACSDDKDRIYAFTGLANDVSIRPDSDSRYLPSVQSSQISLRINYDQSTESSYVKFAEDLISSGRLCWLLDQAIARRPSRPSQRSLPYWVPDWRIKPSGFHYDPESARRINQSSYRHLRLFGARDTSHHLVSVEVYPWTRFYQFWNPTPAPSPTEPPQRLKAMPCICWRSNVYPAKPIRHGDHDSWTQGRHEEAVSTWVSGTMFALIRRFYYDWRGRRQQPSPSTELYDLILESIATLATNSAPEHKDQTLAVLRSHFPQLKSGSLCYREIDGETVQLERPGSDLTETLPPVVGSLASALDHALTNRCLFVIQTSPARFVQDDAMFAPFIMGLADAATAVSDRLLWPKSRDWVETGFGSRPSHGYVVRKKDMGESKQTVIGDPNKPGKLSTTYVATSHDAFALVSGCTVVARQWSLDSRPTSTMEERKAFKKRISAIAADCARIILL